MVKVTVTKLNEFIAQSGKNESLTDKFRNDIKNMIFKPSIITDDFGISYKLRSENTIGQIVRVITI